MSDPASFIFITIEAALLVGPALAYCTSTYLLGTRPETAVRTLLVTLGWLAVVLMGLVSGVSLRDLRTECLWLASGYLAYCMVACSLVRVRGFRHLGAALALPLVAGYLISTIGIIGVGLIAAELVPRAAGPLGTSYRFAIFRFGNATTSDGGAEVRFYRQVDGVPMLERRVFSERYDYRRYRTDEVAVSLEREPNGRRLAVVTAGAQRIATVALH
jgi:hypothetical protein